jgi:SAM-dependent methyltransferase
VLRESNLQRLERAVTPHLRRGWTRAVFSAPQASEAQREEQVVAGPGSDVAPSAEQLAAVFAAAREAARAGLVKHTYVLDERRRVQVDARHGRPALRTLDEAAARKVMGGKDRTLRPDTSGALLRAIGIMNADGSISASHARKYKQVNHLAELCRPTWERLTAARPRSAAEPLRVLDLACGNAYLSFVLAEVLRQEGVPLRLHGVDVREDVVARSRERAATLGMAEPGPIAVVTADLAASFPDADPVAATGPDASADPASTSAASTPRLSFARASIAEAEASAAAALGGPPDLVLALHACDTATDEALALAIRLGVPAVLSVPCCQHELAAQLAKQDPAHAPVPAMLAHGLLRGSYADLLTDSLRVEILAACGYEVAVVEFVSSEHTAKNLLLRAHRRHPYAPVDPGRWRLAPIQARCAQLGVSPDLLRRLGA